MMLPAEGHIEFLQMAGGVMGTVSDEVFRYDDGGGNLDSGLGGQSVGRQFRHILDFYGCFFTGLGTGIVDYTTRSRDKNLERDRELAKAEVSRIIDSLMSLEASVTDRTLRVRLEGTFESPCDGECTTTVMRELQFLLIHTIHHFTIIRSLLSRQGIELESRFELFGVAPSSVRHYRQATGER
jgi:uncharacterized damage-inducible protein DinB